MRQIKFICIHCTAGPQWQTLESIQRYWREVLGWKNPGYHEMIFPDGTVEKLLPIDKASNGVRGYNSYLINISYVGGVEMLPGKSGVLNVVGKPIDNRTPEQKSAMKQRVEYYSDLYPEAIIQGHRDFSPDKNRDGIITPDEWMKACPSFSVAEWLREIGFKSKLPEIYMATTGVNIRKGPGVQFAKVAPALQTGLEVRYLGEYNGWYYVSVEGLGVKGYVKKNYLTEKKLL